MNKRACKHLQLRMNADHEPGADPQSGVASLLPVLVVRPAGPGAGVRQLGPAYHQHLVRHRDSDAVGHRAEAAVGVPEPAVPKINDFDFDSACSRLIFSMIMIRCQGTLQLDSRNLLTRNMYVQKCLRQLLYKSSKYIQW